MTDKSSQLTDILRKHLKDVDANKLHLKADMTDKMMNNVFKGLKLPMVYDEIIGFWDSTILSSCKSGILFVENGCYIYRMFDSTYYVEYDEIRTHEVNDTKLNLVLFNGATIDTGSYDAVTAKGLLSLFIDLETFSKKSNQYTGNKSGPVKDIKDLITKKEYDECKKVIHAASMACGGIGLTPHIPLSDTIVITPIQVGMLIKLGNVFNVEMSKATARSILYSCAGSFVGRNISAVTIGWIPVLGNAVNAVTGFSLTEAIGWKFVRDYATNKNANLRSTMSEAVQVFQDKINDLSYGEFQRFAKDMGFLSKQELADDKEKVSEVFFDIIAQYSFVFRTAIENVLPEYVADMKEMIEKSGNCIREGSRAARYYEKFKGTQIERGTVDFEEMADFIEMFLGFYNRIHDNTRTDQISDFDFNIAAEYPGNFFVALYADKKITDKETKKKYMIHALTSLIYGYAVDREVRNV